MGWVISLTNACSSSRGHGLRQRQGLYSLDGALRLLQCMHACSTGAWNAKATLVIFPQLCSARQSMQLTTTWLFISPRFAPLRLVDAHGSESKLHPA